MLYRKYLITIPIMILVLVGIALAAAACGSSTAATTSATTPATTATQTSPATTQAPATTAPVDASAGKTLYDQDCAVCHGDDGSGGKQVGDATASDVRFTALNTMYAGDWSKANNAILNGIDEDGKDLDAAMPRWSGKLSQADVNNIVAYLKTLKTAAMPTVSDTGDAAAGKTVYTENCAVCHKADGSGGMNIGDSTAADIQPSDLLHSYGTWDKVANAIVNGKDEDGEDLDTEMPRFNGKLSAADLNNLIAYMKTLAPAASPATTQAPATTSATADAANGKTLYDQDCAVCHGQDGSGGLKLGDSTATDVRYASLNNMYNGDWSKANNAILNGIDETGQELDAAMPRWSGKLTDAQVNDIVAYLQTLK